MPESASGSTRILFLAANPRQTNLAEFLLRHQPHIVHFLRALRETTRL